MQITSLQIVLQLADKNFAQIVPTKKQFEKWASLAFRTPVADGSPLAQLLAMELDEDGLVNEDDLIGGGDGSGGDGQATADKVDKALIVIRLTDRAEIQQLNRDFRNKDCPTNILSFPTDPDYWEPGSDTKELGDLVLCVPVVLEEAEKMALLPEDHWAHMIIHGCLHLLGYDHETLQDAQVMEGLEIQLLSELGIANPYANID